MENKTLNSAVMELKNLSKQEKDVHQKARYDVALLYAEGKYEESCGELQSRFWTQSFLFGPSERHCVRALFPFAENCGRMLLTHREKQ